MATLCTLSVNKQTLLTVGMQKFIQDTYSSYTCWLGGPCGHTCNTVLKFNILSDADCCFFETFNIPHVTTPSTAPTTAPVLTPTMSPVPEHQSETTKSSPRLVHLCMMQLLEYKNEVNELLHFE